MLPCLSPQTAAESEPVIHVEPHLSTLRLSRPCVEEFGDTCGLLELPIVVATAHMTPALEQAQRGLFKHTEQALDALVEGTRPVADVATRLVTHETARRLLIQKVEEAFRTIVQWDFERLLADEEYRTWYTDQYATDNSGVNDTDVRQGWEQLQTTVTAAETDPALTGILDGLSQEYSDTVAAIVSSLSLRFEISRYLGEQPDLTTIERLNLTFRCRHIAQTLESQYNTSHEIPLKDLESELIKASDLPIHLTDTANCEYPLLRTPRGMQQKHQEVYPPGRPELIGLPTGLTWLLTKSFTDGGIGVVMYPEKDGTIDWLVNPWACAHTRTASVSYRTRWSRAYVIDGLVRDCFAAAFTPEQQDPSTCVTCSLCAVSTGACGGGRCAYQTYFARETDQLEPLTQELREKIGRTPDRYERLLKRDFERR